MGERNSVWPAAQRLLRWAPLQWAIRAAITLALPSAGYWLRDRASLADVAAVQVQVATEVEVKKLPRDSAGDLVTLVSRISALEQRLQICEDDVKADRGRALRMRLDLIGFQAASAQPRAQQRAETARVAQDTFLELIRRGPPLDTPEDAAYRRALETRPPR